MDKRMVCKCEDEEIDRSRLHNFRREGEGGFMGNTPIFSKKHYEVIAKLIKYTYKDRNNISGVEIINNFIGIFEKDSSRFDADKFREYIGF